MLVAPLQCNNRALTERECVADAHRGERRGPPAALLARQVAAEPALKGENTD